MYIGKINAKASPIQLKVAYYKVNTNKPLPPDETYVSPCAENAMTQGVAWQWGTVLDTGVDIHFQMSQSCFVDELIMNLDSQSLIQNAFAYCMDSAGEWRKVGKGEYVGEKEIKIVVGLDCSAVMVRLEGCLNRIAIDHVDLYGSVVEPVSIYPVPKQINGQETRQWIALPQEVIIAPDNALGLEAFEYLKEKVDQVQLVPDNHTPQAAFRLYPVTQEVLPEEAYQIKVATDFIDITASDARGFRYAMHTLAQLMDGGKILVCEIADSPFKQLRGIHIGLPPREEIPFIKRLIKNLMVPMRLNTLFLQFTAGMRLDTHPEINEAWVNAAKKSESGEWPQLPHGDMIAGGEVLEKSEVEDLVSYAKAHHIEVIPEIQAWGHVQYITLAYPELAETDGSAADTLLDQRAADQPPSTFYQHSYCPSNPRCYEILFEIADEIIAVAKPERYVHFGHDEIYQIGLCPKCKEKTHADLFTEHIEKLHNYLKQKDLKMMIWADMVQGASSYQTVEAIKRIPKDIILLDFIWYFHFDKDIEKNLLAHGFEVGIGNLYSSHFPRYEARINQAGIIGGEVSTWCRPDQAVLSREGKLYDMIYTANMLWSEQYLANNRGSYEAMICERLPEIRSSVSNDPSPALTSTHYEAITLPEPAAPAPADLREAIEHEGSVSMRQLTFNTERLQRIKRGKHLQIPVQAAPQSLVFLHATTNFVTQHPFSEGQKIGAYTVHYTDGSEETISIEYGFNIATYTHPALKPLKGAYYRHSGYVATFTVDPFVKARTYAGDPATLYSYEWINTSHKTIESIACTTYLDADTEIVLASLIAID